MNVENNFFEGVNGRRVLHWNYRGFTDLPIILKETGGQVEELYLKENQITVIPKWIGQLVNLTNLYLGGNKIGRVPDEVGFMGQLRVLDLSDNELQVVPNGVAKLKSLRQLILDDNSICQLPPDFENLEELETLSLCSNNFVTLPEWLGSLNRLQRLLVDNNCLEELPNRLTLAPSLQVVSVCSNRLKHLPLNSFMSPTIIYFNCNPNMNYISYPVLCQLLELGWEDGKSCFSTNPIVTDTRANRNIRLSVDLHSEKDNSSDTAMIKLPRQLIRVFSVENKELPSLWELSLRKLFQNNSLCPKPEIFHNLLSNGPISICSSSQCHQPIFTESWIVVGLTEEVSLLLVLLFCSQKCSRTFDFASHGVKVLPWVC